MELGESAAAQVELAGHMQWEVASQADFHVCTEASLSHTHTHTIIIRTELLAVSEKADICTMYLCKLNVEDYLCPTAPFSQDLTR